MGDTNCSDGFCRKCLNIQNAFPAEGWSHVFHSKSSRQGFSVLCVIPYSTLTLMYVCLSAYTTSRSMRVSCHFLSEEKHPVNIIVPEDLSIVEYVGFNLNRTRTSLTRVEYLTFKCGTRVYMYTVYTCHNRACTRYTYLPTAVWHESDENEYQ